MGECMIGVSNYLRAGRATLLAAPLSGTGYATGNLVDDSVARGWQSNSAAASFVIQYRIDSVPSVSLAAVWGAIAFNGTTKVGLTCLLEHAAASGGPWTDDGSPTLDTRGDGWNADFTSADPHWRWTFTPTVPASLRVGELGLYTGAALSRHFAKRNDRRDWGTIINRGSTGHTYRVQPRDREDLISLEWDALTEAEYAVIAAKVEACRGGLYPVALVPNTSDTQVVHGYLEDAIEWETDDPNVLGVALAVSESGRSISVEV